MRDDGDIALGQSEARQSLNGSDDPVLRGNRAFPSADALFRPREELVRDGLELGPGQIAGRGSVVLALVVDDSEADPELLAPENGGIDDVSA